MLSRQSSVQVLRRLDASKVCWSCLAELSRKRWPRRRPFSRGSNVRDGTLSSQHSRTGLEKEYFSANRVWKLLGNKSKDKGIAADRLAVEKAQEVKAQAQGGTRISEQPILAHRRRRKNNGEDSAAEHIPPDASSQLSALSSAHPHQSIRQRFFAYLSLSKPRLTFLMVLTTTTAYSLFPVAVTPLSASMNLSPLTLLNLTTGTALSSASANALNMYLEPAYDAKMSRTRTRPLVRGLLTPRAALMFATLTGCAGVGLLYAGVNPTVAFLSAINITIYAGIYTPMKRISVINTWIGAIVGGIPPLMGWAAAAGQATTSANAGWRELLFDPYTSAGGWLLAGLLFAWQFPHFNAISHAVRHEYAAAGYRMLASVNTRKSALIALRYSLVMVPICAGLSWVGVTGPYFMVTSSLVNGWMIREAWRFWKQEGGKGSARGLFWASVWHLPLVLVLAMMHKKGLWERFIKGGLDDEELYEYAHDLDVPAAAAGGSADAADDEDEEEVVLMDRVA